MVDCQGRAVQVCGGRRTVETIWAESRVPVESTVFAAPTPRAESMMEATGDEVRWEVERDRVELGEVEAREDGAVASPSAETWTMRSLVVELRYRQAAQGKGR